MSKMSGKERQAYYRHQAMEKKLSVMTHEQKLKLNEILDTMDTLDRSTEEGEKEYNVYLVTLNSYVEECYNKYLNDRIICNRCAYYDSCYRNKTCKSCGHFEPKEEESEETTDEQSTMDK